MNSGSFSSSGRMSFQVWIAFFAYLLVTLAMVFLHEPWRDELQALALVKSSSGFSELRHITRYEGHPLLWFSILFLVVKAGATITAIKLVHWFIMSMASLMFCRFAPIANQYKILVLFGYFFTYEYSVFFRNYAVGLLLLFIAVYAVQRGKIFLAALVLTIAVQANLFALFISGALWLTIMVWQWNDKRKQILLGSVILLAGAAFSFFCMLRPPDTGVHTGLFQHASIANPMKYVWRSFMPVQQAKVHFWNTNFITAELIVIVGALFFYVLSLLCLTRSFYARLFFLLSTGIVVLFLYFKFEGYLRHQGHLFICFVLALWLNEILPAGNTSKLQVHKLVNRLNLHNHLKVQHYFLVTIFIVQVVAAAIAYYYDGRNSFSKASEVASYLQTHHPSATIVGDNDVSASSIAILSGKKFYYPASGSYGSYITWNDKRVDQLRYIKVVEQYLQMKQSNSNVLLVTSYPLADSIVGSSNLQLLKAFTPAIEETEEFFLYR